jgi:thiol-disulfide isomerase/thioredoxin
VNRFVFWGVLSLVLAAFWFAIQPADAPAPPAAMAAPAPSTDIVAAARGLGASGDFTSGGEAVSAYRERYGVTPAGLLALSWLGRSALAAGDLDHAEQFARQTHELARADLQHRPLDREPQLPTALGAAIEVLGQAAVARGGRSEALAFLDRELELYKDTSIAARIQKNIHLLSLEGTPAPELDLSEQLGMATPPELGEGQVVLMFFWAHWCADCKAQGPILSSLLARYGDRGLRLVAPTQRFGYVAGGLPAPAGEEGAYIEAVRRTFYPALAEAAIPLAAANHLRYGVSSTPTLVLVDRAGIIRLYHPGRMSEAELDPLVRALIE